MIYIGMRQRADSAQAAMDYLADNDPVAWILALLGG
jgi:hypothetical protein